MNSKYPPPFIKRLSTRLILTIGAVIICVAAIASLTSLRFIAEETHREFRADVVSLTRVINAAIQEDIESENPHDTQKLLERLKSYRRVKGIRVISEDGRVAYSTDRREVGKRLSTKNPLCVGCHGKPAGRRPLDIEERQRDLLKSYMRTMIPIRTGPGCGGCHPKAKTNVGFMIVDVSTHTRWHLLLSARRSMLFYSLLGVVFMVLSVALVVSRSVAGPISRIIDGLQAVGEGKLDKPLRVRGEDEIALLGRAFEDMRTHIGERIREVRERDTHITELTTMRQDLQAVNRSLNRRVSELTMLNRIGAAVNATLDIEELYRTVTTIAGETLVVESFCLFVYDEKTERLEIKSATGVTPDAREKVFFRRGEGIAGHVLESGHPRIVGDVGKEPDYVSCPEVHPEMRSLIVVPLVIRDQVIGVFHLSSHVENAFSPYDLAFFSAMANQLAIAIDNARHYQLEKERATVDLLTGLANHGHFQMRLSEEVGRTQRYKHPLTLMMFDIDHFKKVNDTYGHPSGDVVLHEVGRIMREHTRAIDVVARYGGEEFAVILPETPEESAKVVAERIRKSVEENPFAIPGSESPIRITISGGGAIYKPKVDTKESLISRADQALYHAKEEGRNRIVFSTV